MLALRPMSLPEFEEFRTACMTDTDDVVRAGTWSREDAPTRAREMIERVLPDGLDTPGHYFRTAVREPEGTRVGSLWFAVDRETAENAAFLYWIGVDPAHRRHGYAAQMVDSLMEEARSLGFRRITGWAWADNVPARTLYEKKGARVLSLTYLLELGETAPTRDAPSTLPG